MLVLHCTMYKLDSKIEYLENNEDQPNDGTDNKLHKDLSFCSH